MAKDEDIDLGDMGDTSLNEEDQDLYRDIGGTGKEDELENL